jgi:thiamine monophosphate synthase
MKKINWAKKLTSRKLWVAIASFVSMLIVAIGGTDNQAAQITALIMAGASVIAYIVGEGLVDATGVASQTTETDTQNGEEE